VGDGQEERRHSYLDKQRRCCNKDLYRIVQRCWGVPRLRRNTRSWKRFKV